MYFIGLDGVSVRLPTRFRNANFARASFEWAIPAVLFLVPLLFVPLAYKWFFGVVFVVTGAMSVYYCVARQRVDLVVSEEGLTLGGVRRSRQIGWDEVARFQIRDPQRRTPFMLAFAPWRDQAQAVLVDGPGNRDMTRAGLCSAIGITLRSPSPRTQSKAMCPTINCQSRTSMSTCSDR